MTDAKQLIRAMFDEVINRGDIEAAEKYLAEDFVDHGPMGDMQGRETFKTLVAGWRGAFPDVHCEVSHLIQEGDLVAWLVHATGTHTGDGLGFPATGRRIDTLDANLGRINAEGKVVEHWAEQGMLATLQQIGVVPTFGPPQTVG
jgi:predicted SnoaL-like aldol condensation-catalyzing enzyme